MLLNCSPDCLCFSRPVNIAHNVSFLVDTSNLKRQDDIKCDDMRSWKHDGTPKRLVRVSSDDEGKLSIKAIKENPEHDTNVYLVTRTYYENRSSNDVRKIIYTLECKLLYKQRPIYSLFILRSLRYLNRTVVRMFLGQGTIGQDGDRLKTIIINHKL